MATQMLIGPYYRLYELPWSPTAETEQRFRRITRNVLIVFLLFGLIIPFLPMAKRSEMKAPELSESVVKLLVEQKKPPPPPPPKAEEPKPEPEKPKPVEDKPKPEPPKPDARKKAEQAAKVFDAFAELRDASVVEKAQQSRNLTAAVSEQTRSERSMLTSKTGVGSGGINTAALSRSFGGGSGSLTGKDSTVVTSSLGSADGRSEVKRTSGSGKGARSREEVELTFDKNKSQIFSIYSRALRENPDLKGKVVLEITIAPTGEVVSCKVVSSELNDPELERKLIARIKLFRFEPRDVESITLTKPIDFFPAG